MGIGPDRLFNRVEEVGEGARAEVEEEASLSGLEPMLEQLSGGPRQSELEKRDTRSCS